MSAKLTTDSANHDEEAYHVTAAEEYPATNNKAGEEEEGYSVGIEDDDDGVNASSSQKQRTVVFNVGGERFETLVSTLLQYPTTMLGSMFSSSERLLKFNSKGEIFLDRDPLVFRIVLNFYRTGKVMVPPGVPQSLVREELDYFGIREDEANTDLINLPPDDQVVLNVGGVRFETKVQTLAKHPETLLGSLFGNKTGKEEKNCHHPASPPINTHNHSHSPSFFDTVTKFLAPSSSSTTAPSPSSAFRVDLNGEIFIDRSPAIFEAIIGWYRTGELHYNPFVSTREAFVKELEYFKIPYGKISNHEAWHKILSNAAGKRIDELQEKAHKIFVKFTEKGLSKGTIIVCPGRFASRPAVIKEDPWEAIVEQNLSFYHQTTPFNVAKKVQEKLQQDLGLKVYCSAKLINVRIGNNPALRPWHILLIEMAI